MRIWLLAFLCFSTLYAEEDLALLNNLINVTEEQLQIQKQLKVEATEFLRLQDAYLKNENDKELLLKVAKKASKVMELIKENHLEQAFETKFLSELSLFARFANKGGIPRP